MAGKATAPARAPSAAARVMSCLNERIAEVDDPEDDGETGGPRPARTRAWPSRRRLVRACAGGSSGPRGHVAPAGTGPPRSGRLQRRQCPPLCGSVARTQWVGSSETGIGHRAPAPWPASGDFRGPEGLVTRRVAAARRGGVDDRLSTMASVRRPRASGAPATSSAARSWSRARWGGAPRTRSSSVARTSDGRRSRGDGARASMTCRRGGSRARQVDERRRGDARRAALAAGEGRPSASSSASSAPVQTPPMVGRSWVVTIAEALRPGSRSGGLVLEPHEAGRQDPVASQRRRGSRLRPCRGPRPPRWRRRERSPWRGPPAARGRRSARRCRRPGAAGRDPEEPRQAHDVVDAQAAAPASRPAAARRTVGSRRRGAARG